MRRKMSGRSPGSRVTALFEDEALSFPLPAGATFEDLADRFAHIAARVNSRALAIKIRLNSPPQ